VTFWRVLFIGLLVGNSGPAVSAPPPKAAKPDWALFAAVRKEGYDAGFEAGKADGSTKHLLDLCDQALSYSEQRERQADKYETCINEIAAARRFGTYVLNAKIDACLQEVPIMKR
jgi:hypothetical protein